MANDLTGNPIYLDDFSAAIDLRSSLGFAEGTPLKIRSIEWCNPTAPGDAALITDKASGRPIFKEKAFVAKQPILKPYYGAEMDNLYIDVNGIATGHLFILLG